MRTHDMETVMRPHASTKTCIRIALPALLLAASFPSLAQDAAFARCLAAMQSPAAARGCVAVGAETRATPAPVPAVQTPARRRMTFGVCPT